jgi:OmpA-OmpF porin, OOP family
MVRRRSPQPGWGQLALAVAALSLSAREAGAQQATALDRFEPAPAGDALFSLPDAGVRGGAKPAFGLVLSYASAPLRVAQTTRGETTRTTLVDHQLIGHAMASVELGKRAKFEFDVPATFSQGGDSFGGGQGPSLSAPSGATLNDLRTGLRIRVLGGESRAPATSPAARRFTASLALSAWLPTGDDARFSGAGAVRVAPAVLVGGEVGPVLWRAMAARRGLLGNTDGGGLFDGELLAGVGVALRRGPVQIGPELYGSGGTSRAALAARNAGAEALLGVRARLGPIELGLAGGPGLLRGVGTPAYRVVTTVTLAPGDLGAGDAVPDGNDSSGHQPGASPSGEQAAPPPDRDGDGVLDADDACPEVVGERTGARPGCPPDRDGDGVLDQDDHCPEVPGVASADPARHGCPADTDGDGIVDGEDACPREKGEATSDPKTSGCPRSVRLEGTQIVILQQVNFTTGKDVIEASSFGLLGQVASVLAEHPEIARLAVDGHTDNRGLDKANLALSQRRAVAVVRWLVDRGGVDARRVEARGFGARRPIADNASEAGRAKNRRVEFQIRKRTPDGARGWTDGPID